MMAHWLDYCIPGGRIAHRLDAASLLHCNPKCTLVPNPIGSPTFPSPKLEARRSHLPRGPSPGSQGCMLCARGIWTGCHVGRCQRLQYAPKVTGKRVAFDLSLETLSRTLHGLLRELW